ncbi:putative reverse transcriptase domain-containing protein [Tanacetum coccineum]
MMTVKYYPRGEIKKLDIELWNLKVKGTDIMSYTLRFQELALINVMSYRLQTMEEAIEFANDQMDQKLITITERQAEQKRKLMFNAGNNQGYQQQNKRQKTGNFAPNNNNNNHGNSRATQNAATCYECGVQGHYKRDCPKLKNGNRGNQRGNGSAPAKVYVVGNAGTNPDSNVVTVCSRLAYVGDASEQMSNWLRESSKNRRWDVIRVTILAFFGSLEVFLELCPKAIYQGHWFDGRVASLRVLVMKIAFLLGTRTSSMMPFSALVLHAPFLDMDCLIDSYLLIQEGFAFEFKIWTTYFDISWSIGADISMIADLAVWTRRTFNIDTDTDDNIIKKMFSIVDSGKSVYYDLSLCNYPQISVIRVLGLWVISGCGLSTCFLHSFSFPRFHPTGFYLERFFNETDFVDNMCRDSHVDLMGNLVPLLMILEIGHRCDDFEYMVLL